MNFNFNFYCPHCKKTVLIEAEIDLSLKFYIDQACPECGRKLPDKINDKGYKEYIDYLAGRADYIRDTMSDR